ncbi:uncharacterized protein CYBJADRAFT_169735 [Cyberlindnera jadinii NRRL Y-1542]|uniref:Uncharacterized protein n=1 Tax=Cyberlindnera jadinii (strain ATCC 18201 / CBS 1600 / BCRC 20928 / JCM 3617 / NBRC 0987 / NRRL Y-1542) TaxID=983966 RepID=A0A1E4RUY9_CYBJN|nr:hypothetical protein CYBJADRAFT_169735 [Cyberlindnera jadinii NRRL Y-1542]ODV71089.1 hypothetical protein CYBJADRAFT_169735 [Cyberlindnera jadinii NRRL Y-1542]
MRILVFLTIGSLSSQFARHDGAQGEGQMDQQPAAQRREGKNPCSRFTHTSWKALKGLVYCVVITQLARALAKTVVVVPPACRGLKNCINSCKYAGEINKHFNGEWRASRDPAEWLGTQSVQS